MTPTEEIYGVFVLVAFGAFAVTLAGAHLYTVLKR